MISKCVEADGFSQSSKLSVMYVQRDEFNQKKGLSSGLLTPYRLGLIERKNLSKCQQLITSPHSVTYYNTSVFSNTSVENYKCGSFVSLTDVPRKFKGICQQCYTVSKNFTSIDFIVLLLHVTTTFNPEVYLYVDVRKAQGSHLLIYH